MIRLEALTLPGALVVARTMRPLDVDVLSALLAPDFNRDAFAVNRWQTDGAAWQLVDDAGPLVIAGLEFKSAWTGCFWMAAHARFDAAPPTGEAWRAVIRNTRAVVANALNPDGKYARQRVEAHVLSTWLAARRLVRSLGFVHEGTCRKAGSGGEDIEIWARVAEGN